MLRQRSRLNGETKPVKRSFVSAPSMVKSCRPTKSKAIRFKPSSLLLMNWYFSTARSGRIRSSPPGRISRAARIRHNGTRRPEWPVLRRFVQSGRQGNHSSRHRHRMSGPDRLQRARQQTATGCEAVFSSGYCKLWKFDTQGRSLSKPESSGIASRNRKRDSQKPVRLFLDDKVEVVFKGPNVPQRHAIPSGRH